MGCRHDDAFGRGGYCTVCGQKGRVSRSRRTATLMVPLLVVPVVAAAALFALGLPDAPESQPAAQRAHQTLEGCTMTTFGTRNADVRCDDRTFYLVRDAPLRAGVAGNVTLEVKGDLFYARYGTPSDLVSYEFEVMDWDQTSYEELMRAMTRSDADLESLEVSIESALESARGVPLMIEQIIGQSMVSEAARMPAELEGDDAEIYELKLAALDDINRYRSEHGVRPVRLGEAVSPDLYARELAAERCIHHVSNDGEGPMLRYKNNGDRIFLVTENIAAGYTSPQGRAQAIMDANYDMMFDDAHADWGHRDNMLNPGHESVSIGLSYEYGTMVMVQDFEQNLPFGYTYHPSSFEIQEVDEKFCW